MTEQSGTAKFFINKNAEQTNSLDYGAVKPFIKSNNDIEIVEVETINLSELLEEFNIPKIDLLKLDIQGSEYPVLKTSQKLFSRIKKLLIEVSFISEDSVQLCGFITNHYPKSKVMGEVKMGADILFEKEEKTIPNKA